MDQEPGGFLPQTGLPSPAPSSTSSHATSTLPHPRGHSLRPGSNKEELVRRFVEDSLLNTSRRYVKKFGKPNPDDTVTGFTSMAEVCRELESAVNVLWKSGTPSLQVPFLLKVASDFTRYVRSFAPSPRATFELLRKLDHCFASLLCGQDIDSKESLPGFENGLRAGMTTTDMVRCRSLVEQTRVLMVEILSSADVDDDDDEEDEATEEEDDVEAGAEDSTDVGQDSAAEGPRRDGLAWDVEEETLHMDAARIYENTIIQLGQRLGDPLGNENKVDNSTVCAK
ncbi:hypothetical protein E4U42_002882 [Claviceps africana]|uniref:Meiotic recombination protein DMC1 n=1 Tax=Claviceps africana TaxID=83212 RepID=A0A8K0JEQ2_9HYPO|nr:hypothetical protein E4U42_002882 [Claviceps africana]